MLLPVLLAALLGSAQPSLGSQAARAWFERSWAESNDDVWVENVRFDLVEEDHELPPPDELARMRRQVPGKPDHPDRLRLEMAERRLKHGPDISNWSIWLGEPGRLRCSQTRSTGDEWCVAITPRLTWAMAPGTVTAVDPREGYPPDRNYGPHEQQTKYRLSGFLRGAFSIGAGSLPLEPTGFTLTGDRWRATVANEEFGFAVLLEGDWDEATRTGQALAATVSECSPAPGEVGKRWEFSDWREEPLVGRQIAFHNVEYQSDGRTVARVNRLLSVSRVTSGELRDVLRLPDLESQRDAFRGVLKLTSMYDYRGRKDALITVRDLETGEEKSIAESQLPHRKQRRWLRYAGWIGGGGIVCILLAGVLLRRMGAGT